MGRRTLSLVMLSGALILWLAWITGRLDQPFVLLAAVLLFVAGGMMFPNTYEIAQQIRTFIGKDIAIEAWGRDLPGHAGTTFRLHRILAFGAGLHLYLAPSPAGKPIHLKIAQPRDVKIDEAGVEIGAAKYVQWQGRKVQRVAGEKAIVLRVVSRE